MKSVLYAPAVGSLMYVMVTTRPDISHVVSRFMHNLGQSHWNIVKHVFRYLASTKHHYILFGPKPTSRRSRLHQLGLRRLCGQSKVNNWILFQIRQWSNFMEVETSRVHSHLNDRSRICSYVRRSERSFMARSAGAHVSASRLRLGSSCLQRQSECCCFVKEPGSSQRLQAYRSSISLCSGLRHFRKDVADGMTKCLSADRFRSLRQQMGITAYQSG